VKKTKIINRIHNNIFQIDFLISLYAFFITNKYSIYHKIIKYTIPITCSIIFTGSNNIRWKEVKSKNVKMNWRIII